MNRPWGAAFRACVKTFPHRFVLVVVLVLDHDFSGVFEDEEENEEEGAIERFSHKLFGPLQHPQSCAMSDLLCADA